MRKTTIHFVFPRPGHRYWKSLKMYSPHVVFDAWKLDMVNFISGGYQNIRSMGDDEIIVYWGGTGLDGQ